VLPGKTYTPDIVLEAAWRHRWIILLPFVVATVGTVLYSNALPDLFRSETLILVVPQRIPESFVRSTVTARIEDRLRSISEQIRSRTRLEQLIIEFNLYPQQRATRPMEEVVEIMDRQIKVETVRGDSFRIAFEAEDAMIPVKVTTRLAQMFIEENQRDRTTTAEDTNSFLESQLADARARLLEHERKLEAFRLQHSGELPSQLQANLQVIQSTQNQIQALAESINRDRDRRLLLEKSLVDSQVGDGTSVETSAGAVVVDPLDVARRELRALESRLTANHPDLIAKRRAVEKLEASRSEVPSVTRTDSSTTTPVAVGPGRARQIQNDIDRIDAQLQLKERESARLQAIARGYQRRVEAVPTRETEMTELMRDYQTLQQMYTSLLAKKEDSNIAANLERRQIGEQFKVLDPARPAERPFSPDRMRLNVMGALAGLFAGVALAALLEYRDSSMRTEEDVIKTLSLPVLAVIPVMESPQEQLQKRRRLIFAGAAGALGLGVAAGAVVRWLT
jgi:polysaccharide chain length determinant protein (PEP-CTERM system associated)